MATAFGAMAQSSSMNFANVGGSLGLTIPFTDISGTALSGSYMVELMAGADAGSLTSVFSGATTFANGFFNAGPVDFTSMLSGVAQVRVWTAAGGTSFDAARDAMTPVGITGGLGSPLSFAYTAPAPGSPAPPPGTFANMTAIQLEIIPEPSTIALGVLGVAGLLLFRRRK